jgi:probable HAF family extracellular repeat protein
MKYPAVRVEAWLIIVGFFLFTASEVRASALYTITDLGSTSNLSIGALNDGGQVVGETFNSKAGKGYAFLYDGTPAGTVTPLGGSSDPTKYPAVRDSLPVAMNNAGEIIALDQQGTITGTKYGSFVYSSGQTAILPGAASGINDLGQVVGSVYSPGQAGAFTAYVYDLATKSIQYISGPGSTSAEAAALNTGGQIVGTYNISPALTVDSQRPFLFSNGKMIALGTLGGSSGNATAINALGDVAGYSQAANLQNHAFIYSQGTMKDLGVPAGALFSLASSINNLGQVVGSYGGGTQNIGGGFVYSDGVMKSLAALIDPKSPWTIDDGLLINNQGQILAVGTSPKGEDYLLLTPAGIPAPGPPVYPTIIPEPSSWMVFGLLTVGLTIHLRR